MTRIWAILAAVVVAVGGILTFFFSAKKAGSDAKQAEQLKETLDAVEDKTALDRELDDADARKRLRDKHYRD